jgi:plastocyanin
MASPSAAASAPAAAAAARIQLVADQTNGGAYNPNSAKAKVGDTVQWTWTDDSAQHSVTSDDGKFDSGLQGKGSTFDQKFTSAGTYKYHCSVHPQMLGQVTVQ